MLRDQRVEPGDALQSFRQPGPCQAPAVIIDELDVVVVLGPVITHVHRTLPCGHCSVGSVAETPAI